MATKLATKDFVGGQKRCDLRKRVPPTATHGGQTNGWAGPAPGSGQGVAAHLVNMTVSSPTPDQEAQFAAWRAMALEQMPYFARILFSLRVLNAPGLGTWAVDGGYRLYIDFDAVTKKGVKWNVESVLHEASHLFAEHKQSAADLGISPADRDIWNVASDFSINDDLDEAGCTTFRTDQMLPEFIGEPNGLTPHHYFAVLQQKVNAAQPNRCGACGKPQDGSPPQSGGSSSNNTTGSQPVEGPPTDGQAVGQGKASCASCGQESGPYKGCGSGSGGRAWDGELDPSDDLGGAAPPASPIEHETIRLSTAAAIQDHVQKGRGTVPGGLSGIAEKILAPSKTPWQKLLASKIRRAVASKSGPFDIDRNRRNRRKHNVEIATPRGRRRVFYPGYYEPVPKIELIRDTSGSMGANDLAVVTREVEAIAKKIGIRGDDFVVTDVDAAVHQTKKFKGRDSIRQVAGRGGTDMCVGIEAAQNRKHPPTAIVVATDGWTGWPTERGRVPVIACIVPEGGDTAAAESFANQVPDFIKTVVVEPAG